ncbi:MAG: flagellar M-ring protein FliF [Desulfovibrio sp.]|uniref:flagellar M-ring protein FliF n=2 Tax=Desulfovibrio sp. TaxID=885 RepID=UPI0025C71356|nr:flagellar M-ring protein FliF [Desulfovibrio sp.]MBS6830189.1 flagellar M-ring protein FliF [Desulfovibrio sp.]
MMKQQRPDLKSLPSGGGGTSRLPSLAELKALRHAQKETNQRVEELKLRLFHITEQHMDQAVRLIRRWLEDREK